MADSLFQFTYELEAGQVGLWSCYALDLEEARALARLHCPDALDCALEPIHIMEDVPIDDD